MDSSTDEIEYLSEKKSQYKQDDTTSDSDTNDQSKSDHEQGDEDQPSGAECLARCKQFAELTGTDTALAMFYLQDTNWNLERGLNSFYEATNKSNKKIVACFDVEKLDEDERRNANKRKASTCGENSASKCSKSPEQIVTIDSTEEESEEEEKEEEKLFQVLSWNIDGLDKANLESRTIGVVKKIQNQNPDIVLLQEVVESSEQIMRNELKKLYEFSSGLSDDTDAIAYYTLILTKKKTCSFKSKNIIHFSNSVMGRNLLQVRVNYKNKVDICAMTAHLESTADFAKQRMEQLKTCFKEMIDQDPKCLVIFGGDLNLRDSELSAMGGLPKQIYDMWESTGSRKECLYTWDCSRNTNLKMNGKYKPKCRFDRLYYRPILSKDCARQVVNSSKDSFTLMPVYFELEGLEKLKSCGRFCSDHWAIQSYCNLEPYTSI